MCKINMKEIQNNLLMILVVFIVLKLIDFHNMNVLDYCIIILAAISVILSIVKMFKGGGGKNAKR